MLSKTRVCRALYQHKQHVYPVDTAKVPLLCPLSSLLSARHRGDARMAAGLGFHLQPAELQQLHAGCEEALASGAAGGSHHLPLNGFSQPLLFKKSNFVTVTQP